MLPALNEEDSIGRVLERMPKFIDKIVVIDDGSTDDTVTISRSFGVDIISHSSRQGLGVVFRSGLGYALEKDFDILVNIDSDGQFDPVDIGKLIDPIVSGECDFSTASRFMDRNLIPEMSRVKFIGNQVMSRLVSSLVGRRFFDVSCGFRAYSRDTLLRINLFGLYTYTQETFLDLVFKGARIKEVPLSIRGRREHGKSKIASNLWRYGYQTLKIILRSYRDYRPLRLLSFFSISSFFIALVFWLPLGVYYLQNGAFTPYKWLGFTGGFFMLFALLFLGLGFILDMFARMRLNQEKILYEVLNMSQRRRK